MLIPNLPCVFESLIINIIIVFYITVYLHERFILGLMNYLM